MSEAARQRSTSQAQRVLLLHAPLASWHLQMAARQKVREAAEAALGLDLGLLVEFTGLIAWRPGASIAFHHDANRWVRVCMCVRVCVSVLVLIQGTSMGWPPFRGS